MAKKPKKRRFRKRLLIEISLGILAYGAATSYEPLSIARRWTSRNLGVKASQIEEILKENNVPGQHLGGLIFMAVHSDYFQGTYERYNVKSKSVYIPDDFHGFNENLKEEVIHEVGHHVYSGLDRQKKEILEEYALKSIEKGWGAFLEFMELEKGMKVAGRYGAREKRLDLLTRSTVLQSFFDCNIFNDILVNGGEIDVGVVNDFLNPSEIFARLYTEYHTGKYGRHLRRVRQLRSKISMEEPEVERIYCEGIRMIEQMVPKGDLSEVDCTLVNAKWPDIVGVLPRHWNPVS